MLRLLQSRRLALGRGTLRPVDGELARSDAIARSPSAEIAGAFGAFPCPIPVATSFDGGVPTSPERGAAPRTGPMPRAAEPLRPIRHSQQFLVLRRAIPRELAGHAIEGAPCLFHS